MARRSARVLAIVSLLAFPLAACSSAETWLFSVTAPSATVTQDSLTLHDVADGSFVAFADRPGRSVRSFDLRTLPAVWGESGLGEDPPNAALSARATDGLAIDSVIVELLSVRSDGPDLVFSVVWETPVNEGTFSEPVLVIDDVPTLSFPGACPAIEVIDHGLLKEAGFTDGVISTLGIDCSTTGAGAVMTDQLQSAKTDFPAAAPHLLVTTEHGIRWTCDWTSVVNSAAGDSNGSSTSITCNASNAATITMTG